jgi:hypothetical protein
VTFKDLQKAIKSLSGPDYDEEKDKLQEKQEGETGELKEETTTNQVF